MKGEPWQIVGIFFVCDADSDQVRLSIDHDEYKWINPHEYENANLISNLHPVFQAFLKR